MIATVASELYGIRERRPLTTIQISRAPNRGSTVSCPCIRLRCFVSSSRKITRRSLWLLGAAMVIPPSLVKKQLSVLTIWSAAACGCFSFACPAAPHFGKTLPWKTGNGIRYNTTPHARFSAAGKLDRLPYPKKSSRKRPHSIWDPYLCNWVLRRGW